MMPPRGLSDVEDVLRAFLRADVEIGVVLERHADQITDGVLRELRELLGTHLSLCGGGDQRDEPCGRQPSFRTHRHESLLAFERRIGVLYQLAAGESGPSRRRYMQHRSCACEGATC